MKLYYTKSSPYAACVRAIISELKISNQIDLIESLPFDNNDELLKINPLGKIPCLVDNDLVVLDSEVICDYLDANFNSGKLFEPIYADWRLKTYYSISSGLIDASVNLRIETMRDKEGVKSDFWWKRFISAIERTLTEIENRLDILPDSITAIHINIYCVLAYIDFRHPDLNWRMKNPQLADFFETMQNRPCFLETCFS